MHQVEHRLEQQQMLGRLAKRPTASIAVEATIVSYSMSGLATAVGRVRRRVLVRHYKASRVSKG
jgi:hypothetical protein